MGKEGCQSEPEGVVEVAVGIKVGVANELDVTTNWGALLPASRLERLIAVEAGVDKTKLHIPLPVTQADTSIVIQVPDLTAAEVPSELPGAGALL